MLTQRTDVACRYRGAAGAVALKSSFLYQHLGECAQGSVTVTTSVFGISALNRRQLAALVCYRVLMAPVV